MVQSYIDKLKQELQTGSALEHSYRPALKNLIESLDTTITAVNEPSRSAHGAPDFVFLNKNNVSLIRGYAETKDIYVDLDQIEKTEQLKRYLGYSNLFLTNYLEFRFFKNGEKYQTITIAKKVDSEIQILEEDLPQLERELKAFLEGQPETIRSAVRLAQIMGGKAARIKTNVISFLKTDNEKNQELLRIYTIMQKLLVHDLTIEKFADMYAQTLVYGLFVARYYDETPENFSRQEARDLIPASNPFLQHFFDHIVGPNFDKRLQYIVDELCDVFAVSAVRETISQHYNLFGETVDKDPVIHFYEDFLKEYDPKLRKEMGAYYTPVPVVQFIINAVDDVLKKEFNLPQGLTDTTKIKHSMILQGRKENQLLHKVQILDPAVGTATFLNETVKFMYQKFKGQEGLWESYVERELLPRLHGFELMMAPYTIAHLKLAMTFKETGIDYFDHRLGIYLTNTLEEGVKIPDDLFSSLGFTEAISEEAKAASVIKHDTPIMIVIGNPPYSGESFNKSIYAMKFVEKYKFEPGGKEKLKERNPKWINDDYVKFIAFAEEMVTKTGEGIVSMITPHGYLENPTFRGMRWHLTETFSSIYVLDLHGNTNKKEFTPDGSIDRNVFDIKQGVSIIIAVKNKTNGKKPADVYRSDVWGTRKTKFDFLFGNTIGQIKWEKVKLKEPMYLFFNTNEELERTYTKGFKLNELMPVNVLGYQTHRDKFAVDSNINLLKKRLRDFVNSEIDDNELKRRYSINESKSWQLSKQREKLRNEKNYEEYITETAFRPFDNQYAMLDPIICDRPRKEVLDHILNKENYCLLSSRQQAVEGFRHCFISKLPANDCVMSTTSREANQIFPLYLYPEETAFETSKRVPNLNEKILNKISSILNLPFVNEKENSIKSFSPIDILDYIYAVLHNPSYRDKYKGFLKRGFPTIPYPKSSIIFWELVKLGSKLRKLHLLEDPELSNFETTYTIPGENIVEEVKYHEGNVFINETQYFGNVPKDTWDFYIGGYQPAQKWLKDRKGKKLAYEDIIHYQKIIKVLIETIQLQKKIDQAV